MRTLLLKIASGALSAALGGALVVPDISSLPESFSDADGQYGPASPSVHFMLSAADSSWPQIDLNLQVGTTSQQCGESNITLNGQAFPISWISDGRGNGDGPIEAYNGAAASWSVLCLRQPDNSLSHVREALHVLKFSIAHSADSGAPSFVLSYRQYINPAIIRLENDGSTSHHEIDDVEYWSNPNVDKNGTGSTESIAPTRGPLEPHTQKTLMQSIKFRFGQTVSKAYKFLTTCNKKPKPPRPEPHHPPRPFNLAHSAHIVGGAPEPTHPPPPPPPPPPHHHHHHHHHHSLFSEPYPHFHKVIVPSLAISVILLSGFIWVLVRCRDPRRRADRAARREERCRRREYRKAERRQKLRTLVWRARLVVGFANPEILEWAEKQRPRDEEAEKLESDAALEGSVVSNDLHGIREAHGFVTSLLNRLSSSSSNLAAKEGRAGGQGVYVSQAQHATRSARSARSVSTLPGYESDEAQPPAYSTPGRHQRASSEGRCSTEVTSDSSVISTSPRISRDGLSSDGELEEKIEPLDISAGPSRAVVGLQRSSFHAAR